MSLASARSLPAGVCGGNAGHAYPLRSADRVRSRPTVRRWPIRRLSRRTALQEGPFEPLGPGGRPSAPRSEAPNRSTSVGGVECVATSTPAE